MHVQLYALALLFLVPSSVFAGDIDCGAMPVVADERVKVDVEGRAQLLLRYIGQGGFASRIEQTREDIFRSYNKPMAARADAALEYQMCHYLRDDETHSSIEKFNILRSMRSAFRQPVDNADCSNINQTTTGDKAPAVVQCGEGGGVTIR